MSRSLTMSGNLQTVASQLKNSDAKVMAERQSLLMERLEIDPPLYLRQDRLLPAMHVTTRCLSLAPLSLR